MRRARRAASDAAAGRGASTGMFVAQPAPDARPPGRGVEGSSGRGGRESTPAARGSGQARWYAGLVDRARRRNEQCAPKNRRIGHRTAGAATDVSAFPGGARFPRPYECLAHDRGGIRHRHAAVVVDVAALAAIPAAVRRAAGTHSASIGFDPRSRPWGNCRRRRRRDRRRDRSSRGSRCSGRCRSRRGCRRGPRPVAGAVPCAVSRRRSRTRHRRPWARGRAAPGPRCSSPGILAAFRSRGNVRGCSRVGSAGPGGTPAADTKGRSRPTCRPVSSLTSTRTCRRGP